ncbi:MAG TPA: biotin/lipoyl-containing protein [Terracidiphilus sp.]
MKLQIGIDGKSYEVDVEVLEDDATPRQPVFAPRLPQAVATPVAPFASAPVQAAATVETAGEDKLVRSPVTGIVIKVNVAPGTAVKANDLVVVLEAMKMETNVTAQSAGKVKNVRVAQGDSVKVGQVIVEFEA